MGDARAAVIKYKPRPSYTEGARDSGIEGKVLLKVLLAASGEVKDIRVIEGLSGGLMGEAIGAARRIEFEPAVHRDGRFLSQWVELEYVFSLS